MYVSRMTSLCLNLNKSLRLLEGRLCLNNCRCISLYSPNKQCEKSCTEYITVYKFPYIRQFSLINRLKFYQTVFTATTIPSAAILSVLGYVDFDLVVFLATLGLVSGLPLHSLGLLTERFIGFIYYNEKKDIVKIAYINFWGKRKDIEIPTRDIMPIKDLPFSFLDGLFLTLRRFSTKDKLKVNFKYGITLDKDKIKQIL